MVLSTAPYHLIMMRFPCYGRLINLHFQAKEEEKRVGAKVALEKKEEAIC